MSSSSQWLQLFFFSLQVIYLGIVGATYYLIVKACFSYIPGYYLSEVHRLFFIISFHCRNEATCYYWCVMQKLIMLFQVHKPVGSSRWYLTFPVDKFFWPRNCKYWKCISVHFCLSLWQYHIFWERLFNLQDSKVILLFQLLEPWETHF